jgi:hypothetical protein
MSSDFKLGQPLRAKIKLAAAQILGRAPAGTSERWQPRTAFVHPGRVSLPNSDPGMGRNADVAMDDKLAAGLEVVTVDFSLTGAGILIHTPHDLLPRRVTLVIDGTGFDCEVRWSEKISAQAARYGLRFIDVLESSEFQTA